MIFDKKRMISGLHNMIFDKKLMISGLHNMIHNGLPDACCYCSLCCDGCDIVHEMNSYSSTLPPYAELKSCKRCLEEALTKMKCPYVKSGKITEVFTDGKPKCNQTELLKILLEEI